ncbi:MFS transporter [Anaerobacillus isosaccharinicus]|uniref:MFS transporter n=1 Tax=Anaerobacillus isosaccharinicus TaxID=1532552 RepID=A0A1S2LI62_9BACI|nr:MFS transporter [Anaerobacillus isosaccharinicus]MBA5586180.1 MFS transporter [Anaerobacillus isosaccharinicus]QOY35557.1 MFS transporter [Anaerobacillus isosaccharinicus]
MTVKQNRWRALFWIALSQLFALSLWFSASVILPELREIWNLTGFTEALVTSSVPLGFIVGALVSSLFGIADRFNARRTFAISAVVGAIINCLILVTNTAIVGILLRFLTGVTLAGVYPIAVKILAGWFPKNRGLAIGILIAALTLGSALPHFMIVFVSSVRWEFILIVSSSLAFFASVIMYWFVNDPPTASKKTVFSFKLLKKVIQNKPVMLANYGYFGHMWELYAMWTWLPAFLTASFIVFSPETAPWLSALAAFLAIGVSGAIGCVAGGYIADKIGRARLTILALAGSSLCAIIIGFTFGKAIWLTLIIAMVWGVFVIADSAQFSAAVSDFAEVDYVGTALTFQMCIGFAITIITIQTIPIIQSFIGWEWVFAFLSIGPILGIISMEKLRGFEKS